MIGLVGGVGSGKSSLARWLEERERVVVIDGDRAGHDALNDPRVRERIRDSFGNAVFDAQGRIDRAVLAQRVFGGEPEQQQARTELQRIVHPLIRDRLSHRIAEARETKHPKAILLDAAVLLEGGWDDLCDAVVFVEAPSERRQQRVLDARRWNTDELQRREASQWSLSAKRRRAGFIIDNSGSLDDAGADLQRILDELAR